MNDSKKTTRVKIKSSKHKIGDRRKHFCKKANENVEQEWTGTEWLCLHN